MTVSQMRQDNLELYIRHLSPQDVSLGTDSVTYDAEKFFEALQSDSKYNQYIAINMLVRSFNDESLRARAVEKITPFVNNEEKNCQTPQSLP